MTTQDLWDELTKKRDFKATCERMANERRVDIFCYMCGVPYFVIVPHRMVDSAVVDCQCDYCGAQWRITLTYTEDIGHLDCCHGSECNDCAAGDAGECMP